jgi:hypothetical protein
MKEENMKDMRNTWEKGERKYIYLYKDVKGKDRYIGICK